MDSDQVASITPESIYPHPTSLHTHTHTDTPLQETQELVLKRVPCDQCHSRKIRCNNGCPCDKCLHSELECTRTIVRKRRGPKKGSGTVLKRLRENGRGGVGVGAGARVPGAGGSGGDATLNVYCGEDYAPASPAPGDAYERPRALRTYECTTASPYATNGRNMSSTPNPTSRNTVEPHPSSTITHTTNPYFLNGREPPLPLEPYLLTTPYSNPSPLHLRSDPPTPLHTLHGASPHSLQSVPSEFSQSPNSFGGPFSPWSLVHRTSYESDAGENHFLSVNELAHKILGPGVQQQQQQSQHQTGFSSTNMQAMNERPPPSLASMPSSSTLPHGPTQHSTFSAWSASASLRDVEAPQVLALSARVGLKPTLIALCIDHFFRNHYPIMPVIHESSFRRRLYASSLPADETCQLIALCAMTILHVLASPDAATHPDIPSSAEDKKTLSAHLIQNFLAARLEYDYTEHPTLPTVLSSLFLSVAHFEHKNLRSWWFYLREACGIAYDLRLADEATYTAMQNSPTATNATRISEICHRRTLALLVVTERGAGLLRNKPIALRDINPTLHLSHAFAFGTASASDEDPAVLAGFRCLVRLFALVDADFFRLWNAPHTSPGDPTTPYVSAPHIASVQEQLAHLALRYEELTPVQRADVLVTQQWLKLIYWQAAMRQGMVSSGAGNEAFRYSFPIEVARVLCGVLGELELGAILVHGLGIFEKLFEIAYSLMDALTLSKVALGESGDLKVLFGYLSASEVSHDTYVRMLVTKMDGGVKALQSLHGQKLLQSEDLPMRRVKRRGGHV